MMVDEPRNHVKNLLKQNESAISGRVSGLGMAARLVVRLARCVGPLRCSRTSATAHRGAGVTVGLVLLERPRSRATHRQRTPSGRFGFAFVPPIGYTPPLAI
jgi:hypothetical protein